MSEKVVRYAILDGVLLTFYAAPSPQQHQSVVGQSNYNICYEFIVIG